MIPPISETDFLARVKNFAELRALLSTLGMPADLPTFDAYVNHIATCWFRLGEEHLADAKASVAAGLSRSAYSRAYYAAYNVSKSIRFLTKGWVSLKGDDHKASPDLPADLPNTAIWGVLITDLYEHRLRADYDNWSTTAGSNTLAPALAVSKASDFVEACRLYIHTKRGISL